MMSCQVARQQHWMAPATETGNMSRMLHHSRGFTLIEIMVVLLFVALLASLVTPMVVSSIEHAKESTLKEDLSVMRRAIDAYRGDKGKYPEDLETLVKHRYIRVVPIDPFTGRADSWVLKRADEDGEEDEGIRDVRSGYEGLNADGESYATW